MSPFDPIGEKARWRIIYDALVKVPIDGVIDYATLGGTLDLDPDADRHAIQMAMRRAARELEEVEKRAVESVPNIGYRVVQPPEHLRLAQQQQRRSRKALMRGQSKVVNVDMNALDPETRKAFDVVGRAFAMMMDLNRRLDTRQKRLENTVEEIVGRSDRSEAEIAELKERIARLESTDG